MKSYFFKKNTAIAKKFKKKKKKKLLYKETNRKKSHCLYFFNNRWDYQYSYQKQRKFQLKFNVVRFFILLSQNVITMTTKIM